MNPGLFIRSLLFYLLVLQVAFATAQSNRFRQFSSSAGIAQPYIYTINQDASGFLWVGTSGGLYKFDGFTFAEFSKSDSLPSNFITTSFRDSTGRLWFGHDNGAVSFLHNQRFTTLKHQFNVSTMVMQITQDRKGNIWIATQRDGLLCVAPDGTVVHHTKGLAEFSVAALSFSHDGAMLLGTNLGLLLFSDLDFTSRNFLIKDVSVQCLSKRKNVQSFTVGTSYSGVFKLYYNGGEYVVSRIRNIDFNLDLESLSVQSTLEDNAGNFWICTYGNGVYKLVYSQFTGNYVRYQHYNRDNGLGTSHIHTLYVDRENDVWLGTMGEGLFNLFNSALAFHNPENGIYGSNVLSIESDGKTKWLGMEEGLLETELSHGGRSTFYSKDLGFPSDKVTAILLDGYKGLWVGTGQEGLYNRDAGKGVFRPVTLSSDLAARAINHLAADSANLWIATKAGLFRRNIRTGKTAVFNTSNGLGHNDINYVTVGREGEVWVAVKNSHQLTMIDAYDQLSFFRISTNSEVLNINCMKFDNHGRMWISTSQSGIFSISKNQVVRNFKIAEGLKSNYCYGLEIDKKQDIWVGHDKGLTRFDPGNEQAFVFDYRFGLTADINQNALHLDGFGNLWFGSQDGLIQHEESGIDALPIPPRTNILSVEISGKPYNINEEIRLGYGSYDLEVEFIAINLSNPSGIQYEYQLVGIDTTWQEATEDRIARYERLNDGNYTFMVRACNGISRCNEVATSFSVTINRPFWKKSWFYIAIAVGLFFIVYTLVRVRERSHRRRQEFLRTELDKRTKEVVEQKDLSFKKELEKQTLDAINKAQENERKRFASDLHDGLGQLLSGIRLHVNALEDEAHAHFDERTFSLYESSIEMIDRAIKETRAISHNLMPGSLSEYGLDQAMIELIQTIDVLDDSLEIAFHSTLEGQRFSDNIELTVYRVTQEIVQNTIKHAQAKNLSIELILDENQLILHTQDDGIGFDTALKKGKGIGLGSLENRVKSTGGQIEFISQTGIGTMIEIIIPVQPV